MAASGSLGGAGERFLGVGLGHVARGTALPTIPADAVEAFLDRVAAAYRDSLATGLEHGFLAYAPAHPGAPLVPEATSVGSPDAIRWHWGERQATVALSFHTHPGDDALCIPSGIDAVGALVRGDHLLYILTHDGRLSGWRFRDPSRYPRAVIEAMRNLEAARSFRRPVLDFLYEAFDALRPRLLKPTYAARVALTADGGLRVRRARPGASFFLPEERTRACA